MKKVSLLMGIFGLTGAAMLLSGSLTHQSVTMVAADDVAPTAEVTGIQVRSGGETASFIVPFSC